LQQRATSGYIKHHTKRGNNAAILMLTDRSVRDAKARQSVYRMRDSNVVCRGFGLTVAPSGAKTFFLSYTSPEDGKRKQVAIGRFPDLSLRDARMKAGQLREAVDAGRDPAVEKQYAIVKRIETRQLGTLGDLLDLYVLDLETDEKRTATEVKRIRHKDIPPTLRDRPAHLISKDNILDILTPIAQRGAPVHSDNVRAYLRAAFELGLNAESTTRWRGRAIRFELQHNPVAAIKKTVSRKPRGNRNLSRDEIRTVWHTDLMTPPMLLAVKLLMATGQRVEEVLHASWPEFDLIEKVWVIPGERRKTRSQTSEPHIVPLTEFHIGLLTEVAETTQHEHYLFPARGGGSPRRYDALTHAVRVFVAAIGMQSFSPRDIRRTFKTVAGSLGISLEMRNRLQGHAMTDVGSVHYDRYDYLPEKREAMAKWAGGLAEIVGTKA
jgi:integrase